MLLQMQISVTQRRNNGEKLQSENSKVSHCCKQNRPLKKAEPLLQEQEVWTFNTFKGTLWNQF